MGLAYAIFSYMVSHKNAGYLMVYAGTGKKTGNRVVALIAAEMRRLKKEPVTLEELGLVKDFVKGVIFLGLESTISRMAYLAKQEIYHGDYETLDGLRKRIDAVTREDILRVAELIFVREHLNLVVLGDLSQFKKPTAISLG
jgi:predicted Zn-dependent peptidase